MTVLRTDSHGRILVICVRCGDLAKKGEDLCRPCARAIMAGSVAGTLSVRHSVAPQQGIKRFADGSAPSGEKHQNERGHHEW